MFQWVSSPEAWIALLTLSALLIVLGVDNVLFISILSTNLPEEKRSLTRRLGLGMALGGRLIMLFGIAWIMSLDTELFALAGHAVSGKDLILMSGGLFLLWKSTTEIHDNLEGPDVGHDEESNQPQTMRGVLFQVFLLDAVFSIDSVITAIGMVKSGPEQPAYGYSEKITIIVIAMLISMAIMIISVNAIGEFIEEHPSFKMLALSFLILVGTVLMADGMGFHIPRGYLYFAMAFSASVEFLNLKMRKQKKKALHLRKQPPSRSHSSQEN